MCGFVGCFGKIDKAIAKAGKKIFHRGPDNSKYYEGKDWCLQFNRLSIIDLSDEAMQPFSYDSVEIFVNGEIYNYIELKKKFKEEYICKTNSDIEILPFMYRKFGIDFLNQINGMFSMVIVDSKKNIKLLIRDRYGKKPLYYTIKKNNLYFASELKALTSIIDAEIDKENIAVNLVSNLIIAPLTPYKNIFSVMPGQSNQWINNKAVKNIWYNSPIIERKSSYREIRKNFENLSTNSVNIRLRSDVPVGIFLSGGLDSNYILKKILKKNKNIFTLICNIPDKDKFTKNDTDTEIPKKICKEFKCKSKVINFDYEYFNNNLLKIIKCHDEIITSSGVLIFYALSEEAKKNNIKVILTGVGGDELAGGYYWQNKLNIIPNFLYPKKNNSNFSSLDKIIKMIFFKKNRILMKFYKLYQLLFKPQIYHVETHGVNLSFFLRDVYDSTEKRINETYKEYLIMLDKKFGKNKSNSLNFKNIYLTISTQNYFLDILTMVHSVENRSPLLDFELFEYMMSVPRKIKNKKGIKSLYKKFLEENLPKYVINAKKSGPNLPIKFWFDSRPLIKKKVLRFINNNLNYIESYISKDLALNLKNGEIVSYDKNWSIIFKILCLIIWFKINIDKSLLNTNQTLEQLIDI